MNFDTIKPTRLQLMTAIENGISKNTLNHRLNVYGWTMERAISESPKKGNTSTVYTAKDVKRARENGISLSTFSARVNSYKWSVEDAINTPVGKRRLQKNV